jgi:hypothetical protein
MSDVTVTVDDEGLKVCIDVLSEDFKDLAEGALTAAFINGGVMEDVWRRTPKSQRAKYAERIGESNAKGTGLKRGWRDRVTPEQADRLDSYGQTRLANSLLPDGAHTRIDVLGFRKTADGVEMTIASDVPYAGRMHETDKPPEGDYWTPGNGGHGWSTQGTGNKYIEDIVKPERMAQAMADRLNARMRV